jgi:hypothetical protein
MLNKVGYLRMRPRLPEEVAALKKVIRWRAHLAQHKRDEGAQQAGAPAVAAPGTGAQGMAA